MFKEDHHNQLKIRYKKSHEVLNSKNKHLKQFFKRIIKLLFVINSIIMIIKHLTHDTERKENQSSH